MNEADAAEVDPRVAPWICEGSEAIELKLVSCEEDVDNESITFHPEFTHQVVGQRYAPLPLPVIGCRVSLQLTHLCHSARVVCLGSALPLTNPVLSS